MQKLTKEQFEARLEMYEEAASHMEQSVSDIPVEQEQAKAVAREIRNMQRQFQKKDYYHLCPNPLPGRR